MEAIEGNGHSESAIPDKSLFRIGEVSRLTSTKPFVLRYWETEFPMLQPVKSPKGHRLYRREDIETVFVIKRLLVRRRLYDRGRAAPPARSGAWGERNERRRGRRGVRMANGGESALQARFAAACNAQPRDLARPARLAPLLVDGPRIRVIR